MKLSGVQRLGIVLSCLWLVAVVSRTAYERFGPFESCDHTSLTYLKRTNLKQSENSNPARFDLSTAVPVGETRCPPVHMERRIRIERVLVISALPVLAVWLAIFLGFFAVRWIRAGFRSDKGAS